MTSDVLFTAAGLWRVYFNRHGAAPLTWCVAPEAGDWELAVRWVQIATPSCTTYQPQDQPNDGRPSAWMQVEGRLTVFAAGHATIGAP